MGVFVFYMILFALITLICVVALFNGAEGELFIIILICGFLMWLIVERKTVRIGDPTPLDHKNISVMCDDEIAIIRHDDKTYEYTTVKFYKAIKEGNFDFMEIKEYDILGEYNGSTFELKLK